MDKLIWVARALLIGSIIVGWESLSQTFAHVSDPRFLITGDHPGGVNHGQYHALREWFGNMGAIAALILIFFAPVRWRNPIAWLAALVIMIGYYAPFWAGMPFIPELSAPTLSADFRHFLAAALAILSLAAAWPSFMKKQTL